jgi:homoserine O-succinyltransferase
MPIKIPSGLPARDILDSERIFALEKPEAEQQRVRPLRLVILNLMPKKIETETQLLRLISKSPLQVDVDFMKTSTHEGTHVSSDHLVKFYENPDEFADNYYDGLVITGAPVEHLDFAQVDYWPEFKEIVDWASRHVFSTMYLCWGAMGALELSLRGAQGAAGREDLRRLPAVSAGRVLLPDQWLRRDRPAAAFAASPGSTRPMWRPIPTCRC